jgi:glutaredoxin
MTPKQQEMVQVIRSSRLAPQLGLDVRHRVGVEQLAELLCA